MKFNKIEDLRKAVDIHLETINEHGIQGTKPAYPDCEDCDQERYEITKAALTRMSRPCFHPAWVRELLRIW